MTAMPEPMGEFLDRITTRPDAPTCAHCGGPAKGYAHRSTTQDGQWVAERLCHESGSPDCYHLVTSMGHPAPCPDCPGDVWVPFSVREALRTWEQFKAGRSSLDLADVVVAATGMTRERLDELGGVPEHVPAVMGLLDGAQ